MPTYDELMRLVDRTLQLLTAAIGVREAIIGDRSRLTESIIDFWQAARHYKPGLAEDVCRALTARETPKDPSTILAVKDYCFDLCNLLWPDGLPSPKHSTADEFSLEQALRFAENSLGPKTLMTALPTVEPESPRPADNDLAIACGNALSTEVRAWIDIQVPDRALFFRRMTREAVILSGPPQIKSSSTTRKSRDEHNENCREYLQKNPEATTRQVSGAIGCGMSMLYKLPAWKAVSNERRKGRVPKPKAVSISNSTQADTLERLRREQASDDRRNRVGSRERV